MGYGDPAGAAELRTVLASYVRRVRAADVDAGQVLVCGGFAQGLSLTLAALAARGIRHVGFEDPGYDRTVETTAHRAGVTAIPIPVDSRGIDVDVLAASNAQAVVVSPAHQWPTGVVLAADRRRHLVAWAAEVDGFVVEDDYDAEFRYDRDPVGSLQGLAPDRVVTIGTVSKSLAPALRLGWVLSPAELTEPITAGKRDADRGTPTLDQLALAHLMRSGRFDRHLRRMRTLYSDRRRTLTEALAELAPQVRLSGLAAGFHAVAHLPDRANEAHVIGAARDRGVGLYGMSQHRASGLTRPPQLVLGFGNLTDRAIRSRHSRHRRSAGRKSAQELSWRLDANSEPHRKHKRPSSSSERDRPCESLANPLADSTLPGESPCGLRREANHGQIHPQHWQIPDHQLDWEDVSTALRNLSADLGCARENRHAIARQTGQGPGCRSAHAPGYRPRTS